MENATQLLYQHALLPEPPAGAGGEPLAGSGAGEPPALRINLTFRSHLPTPAAPPRAAAPRPEPPPPDAPELEPPAARATCRPVFVGLTPGVPHVRDGFKQELHHPFETPFVDDAPELAARRYRAWLLAQPALLRFVCAQLRGRALEAGDGASDAAHARGLRELVDEFE